VKIGDLARSIYTGELFVVTSLEDNGGYHNAWLIPGGKEFLVPKEHLEVYL